MDIYERMKTMKIINIYEFIKINKGNQIFEK